MEAFEFEFFSHTDSKSQVSTYTPPYTENAIDVADCGLDSPLTMPTVDLVGESNSFNLMLDTFPTDMLPDVLEHSKKPKVSPSKKRKTVQTYTILYPFSNICTADSTIDILRKCFIQND